MATVVKGDVNLDFMAKLLAPQIARAILAEKEAAQKAAATKEPAKRAG